MKRSTSINVILALVYKATLDVAFYEIVKPVYGYQAQFAISGEPSSLKCLVGYLIAWFGVTLCNSIRKEARVSRFIVLVQVMLIMMPFASLYGIEDLPSWQMGLIILGISTVAWGCRFITLTRIRSPGKWGQIVLFSSMGCLVLYVYVGLIATGGMSRFNLNLNEVYKFRDEMSNSMFPFAGYLIPWSAYIFNMAFFVNCIKNKSEGKTFSVAMITFSVLMQVAIFSMTGHKSYLFAPLVIIVLMHFSKRIDLWNVVFVGAPACIILLVCVNSFLSDMGGALLGRLFFTPAALHGLYFDYFSTHPYMLLHDTFGNIFGSHYQERSVEIIANRYWGESFDPNVGWIADAYANLGIAGIIFYGIVMSFFLRLADSMISKNIPPGVIEGLLIGPAFAFISSALGTVLLTHGFLVALLTLWGLNGLWSKPSHLQNKIAVEA